MFSSRGIGPVIQRSAWLFSPLKHRYFSTAYKKLGEELIFTESCLKKIAEKKKGDDQKLLRISVEGGEGCSGYVYAFNFDKSIEEDDFVLERDNTKYAVIDETSLKFLKGSVIDYEEVMVRAAFVVQENPNAEKACSCKVSFAPKDSLFS